MLDTLLQYAASLLFIAFLTESLTEILKSVFPLHAFKGTVTYFVSVVVGIILALVLDVNILGLTDPLGYYVSIACAGLLASRGANYINGALKRFSVLGTSNKDKEENS